MNFGPQVNNNVNDWANRRLGIIRTLFKNRIVLIAGRRRTLFEEPEVVVWAYYNVLTTSSGQQRGLFHGGQPAIGKELEEEEK